MWISQQVSFTNFVQLRGGYCIGLRERMTFITIAAVQWDMSKVLGQLWTGPGKGTGRSFGGYDHFGLKGKGEKGPKKRSDWVKGI